MHVVPKQNKPGRSSFKDVQYAFAARIRDPENRPLPDGVTEERMTVYQELFYNNVEGVLSNAFPVIRSLMDDQAWHRLARAFFQSHHASSPYFSVVPKEFLDYLEGSEWLSELPGFFFELAHYEWVEMALAIADEEIDMSGVDPRGDLMDEVPVISPLVWQFSYQYPVHQIGQSFQPDEPSEMATHLAVYRNRSDEVEFMELNPVTARLLQLIGENRTRTGRELLVQIAEELNHPNAETVINGGLQIFNDFRSRELLLGTSREP